MSSQRVSGNNKKVHNQSCTQYQSNITLCPVSVNIIYQAMTRVCEGGQPAWQNLDLLGNSCHLDTWLMLMTSAIVADSKQQVNYKNRFDNDSGTFNRCVYTYILTLFSGKLFALLESMGANDRQNMLRDQYWREQLPIIPFGKRGGVWDHARAYAEKWWGRGKMDPCNRQGVGSTR